MEQDKKIFCISLGCPKNLVDTEVMLGALGRDGWQVCAEGAAADLILVNTCGFIRSAVEEAIDEILAVLELKKEDPGKRVVVTGCLVQRYREELVRELPEVDLFAGTDEVGTIATLVRRLFAATDDPPRLAAADGPSAFLMHHDLPRRLATPPHRAYLKITEGCSNHCSYCMIPAIRGRLRSRPVDDLLAEARELEARGVRELTLVGQDLTAYGRDLGANAPDLAALTAGLLENTTIPWLRMLYLYPNRVTAGLIETVAAESRLLPYFDIPLQHVSPTVLKAMRRPYADTDIPALIARIRDRLPSAALRSTFITGFPGETEDDVEMLAAFLRNQRLDNVGVFAYSNEEGSAAANLPGHLPEEIKEERRRYLMEIQAGVAAAINRQRVGRRYSVLVEGESRETELLVEGRTFFQAPEIDGCVYINEGECISGEFVEVEITESHVYDLVGRIVGK